MRLLQLSFVQGAMQRDIAVAEFFERPGLDWIRKEWAGAQCEGRTPQAGNYARSRCQGNRLQEFPAGDCVRGRHAFLFTLRRISCQADGTSIGCPISRALFARESLP